MSSSSTVLGDSSPSNTIKVEFRPAWASYEGRGTISLNIPQWYDVPGSDNMMFNARSINTCSSPDFNVVSSEPDIISSTLRLKYDSLPPEKMENTWLEFSCQGFYNPIYEGEWEDFRITLLDG